jgi:hypothetical protein
MIALGITAMIRALGGKAKITDFLPFTEIKQQPQTMEEQMAIVDKAAREAARQWHQ